jgi:hypothetical protein
MVEGLCCVSKLSVDCTEVKFVLGPPPGFRHKRAKSRNPGELPLFTEPVLSLFSVLFASWKHVRNRILAGYELGHS